MNETTKAHNRRAKDQLFREVFTGLAIEMGSGEDPLRTTPEFPDLKVEWAVDWAGNYPNFLKADVESFGEHPGQENFIGRYDLAYSSQCLEHVSNPGRAIFNWWRLVKPGGAMVLTVPDFVLYENAQWPHMFNSQHVTAWRENASVTDHVASPGCIPLRQLVQSLPNSELMKCAIEDTGYDHELLARVLLGAAQPTDQTMPPYNAEAFIEAVVRKTK